MARASCIRPVTPLVSALALALPMLAGCATPPRGQRDLLDFVVDGRTSCAEARERLGPPDAVLEDGRISMYRIGRDKNGYTVGPVDPASVPQGPGIWSGLEYSFVVVCDPSGTVARHALVPVKTEQGEESHAQGR